MISDWSNLISISDWSNEKNPLRYKYRSPNIDVYKDTLSKEGFQIKLTSDWWRAPSGGHSFENFDKLWERLKESENIKIKNVKKWFSQGRI